MNGVDAILKAVGILGTFLSIRVALSALKKEMSPSNNIAQRQTELLERIDARLAQIQQGQTTPTDDFHLW